MSICSYRMAEAALASRSRVRYSMQSTPAVPQFACELALPRTLTSCALGAGATDATVILKATPGSRRWQHMARGLGRDGQDILLSTEENYTLIFGSHRNTSLKVEKNGLPCSVVSVPLPMSCQH